MSEPYLVAHKVRGEPAFDIATRMTCAVCEGTLVKQIGTEGDGPCDECDGLGYWWIIPTSGHRAFPYWSHKLWLGDAGIGTAIHWEEPDATKGPIAIVLPPPAGWPDHYPTAATPSRAANIAAILGLGPKPTAGIRRR